MAITTPIYPPELTEDYNQRLGIKCIFYLREKKRFCRMLIRNGSHPMCAQHQEILDIKSKPSGNEGDTGTGDGNNDRNSRVPCPLDNGHTVKLRLLHKHLKVCNARKIGPDPPYFNENINAIKPTLKSPIGKTVKELTDTELMNLVQKIHSVHQDHIPQIKKVTATPAPNLLNLEVEAAKEENFGKEAKRHFRQVLSILNILYQEDLIQPNTVYIEFGSGRGKLTFWLGKVLMADSSKNELSQSSKFVLIDRKSPRHKKDNKLAETLDINRIRIDIKDLELSKILPDLKDYNIVGISKHFCGSATDMGLRCLLESNELRNNVQGIIFTSCCHHLCDSETFIGTKSLENWGFSGEEFRALSCITSWYVCGTGTGKVDSTLEKKDENNQRFIQLGLNLDKRREVGYKAKRIIDHARTEYISTYGLDTNCQSYCAEAETFENTALIAKRPTKLNSNIEEEEEKKNVNGQKLI